MILYLEKGAECLENYMSSIDNIFLNIKSSSSLNSGRSLSSTFFGDEINQENSDRIESEELNNRTDETSEDNLKKNSDDIFDFKYNKIYAFTKNITNIS